MTLEKGSRSVTEISMKVQQLTTKADIMHINIAFVQENIEVIATTGSKNDADVVVMVVSVMMMMITYRAQICQHCDIHCHCRCRVRSSMCGTVGWGGRQHQTKHLWPQTISITLEQWHAQLAL